MKKNIISNFIIVSIFISQSLFAVQYQTPPSSSASGSGSVISDAAMEECVKLYNKAKWLMEDIDRTQVDSYNQSSVNSYNKKVNRHGSMIKSFNRDCAGKQSYSAHKAAQRLNNR